MKHKSVRTAFAWIGLLVALFQPRCALGVLHPSELLLITNKNVPQSRQLADLYCQLRSVPSNHVVELDLPFQDEIPFDQYETGMVAPVRQYIQDHHLRDQIKCLVPFYGVPFRVSARKNSDADQQELAELNDLQKALFSETTRQVSSLEKLAESVDPTFKPGSDDSLNELLVRTQAAISTSSKMLSGISDQEARGQDLKSIILSLQVLGGTAEIDNRLGESHRTQATSPEEHKRWMDLHLATIHARAQLARLQSNRWDADARRQLRLLAHDDFGLFGTLHVVDSQISYFQTTATAACTDNELALLWWDFYPRSNWIPNPLKFDAEVKSSPLVMMVMRLDAPDASMVERIMRDSVAVEKTGLDGTIALDARGLYPDAKGIADAYAQYDEKIRNLSVILRTKTSQKVRIDDQDIVFPPHSVKNVAVYCGWYSVQNYIPGCDFVRGAVGFHIASYEMVTLHDSSTRWVRGLLKDGVDATLGSVLEPGLDAFPRPDEFFPLLLTGKLTMAEVYWKTCPFTSWMISFIGDPLYTPYKIHPAMRVEDLPGKLASAIIETPVLPATLPYVTPATQTTTAPATGNP